MPCTGTRERKTHSAYNSSDLRTKDTIVYGTLCLLFSRKLKVLASNSSHHILKGLELQAKLQLRLLRVELDPEVLLVAFGENTLLDCLWELLLYDLPRIINHVVR